MAQTATHSAPSPAPILELIHAFRKSSILFVGIRIGLFDSCAHMLPHYSKPFSSDAVDRFLRASASLGLILVHSENEVTRFSLTDVSTAYLLTNAPTSLAGYIHHSDVTIVPLFLALPYSLETGDSAWPAAFPRRSEGTYRLSHLSTTPESRVSSTSALPSTNQGPSPLPGSSASNNTTLGSFDSLYATPLSRDRFLRAMHAHATLSATLLASAFDLSWAHRAVDLGGASGALALALKEKWGESGLVEVCVVDLPSVVEDSVRIWEWFRDGRVRAVPGDFLAD
ncbi:hypothetical protein DFJ73DRAFT_914836 [Zopfochytrium polystomum]|nr:hypothetical protein DFJ73DRAFT_914836 [Zopfochytrium polystomum]